MLKMLEEDLKRMYPKGAIVFIKGLSGHGEVVDIPEGEEERFKPWHVPVRWKRNNESGYVNQVPYMQLKVKELPS